jgi:hypothetical protein
MNQIEEKQMENKIRYFCSLLTWKRGNTPRRNSALLLVGTLVMRGSVRMM